MPYEKKEPAGSSRVQFSYSSAQRTVTATELSLLAAAKPVGRITEIVVEPELSGMKFVTALSEPPVIVTDEPMEPTLLLELLKFTVTDLPPATCCTAAKLLSGLSWAMETVNGAGPAPTVVEKKGVPSPNGGASTAPAGASEMVAVRLVYPGTLAV